MKKLFLRFRNWQKSPARNWSKGAAEHSCSNCGHVFTGNYCPLCGQQAGYGRITWRWVGKSILDVWGMDTKSLPYTILQLLLRPGYLIGDYIGGHRQACYKPVNMLFIVAVFYALATHLLSHGDVETTLQVDDELRLFSAIYNWLSTHPAWAAISLTTIMTLPTYLLFRFAPRHTRHSLPEGIFIQMFMCTLMLICILASKVTEYLLWLVPFYYYITYRQLFGYRPWGTLWRLVLGATVWLILLVLIAALAIMLPTMDDFDTVLVALLLLFLAAIPLAAGYWIGKKTARPQDTDIQQ